jgi:hypothetical protein
MYHRLRHEKKRCTKKGSDKQWLLQGKGSGHTHEWFPSLLDADEKKVSESYDRMRSSGK